MIKNLLIAIFCSGLMLASKAQLSDYDTNYIQTFEENFYPYIFNSSRDFRLALFNSQDSVYKNYSANSISTLGFGVDYKIISFSLGLTSVVRVDERASSFTIGTGITKRTFKLGATIRYFRGFRLSDGDTTLQLTSPLVRPNLLSRTLQVSYFYIFNSERASYRGSFSYFEKQKKNAGSWIAGTKVAHRYLYDDPFLFAADSTLGTDKITQASNFTLSVNGGGFYTFTFWKHWHFSLLFALNIHYDVDLTGSQKARENAFSGGADFRAMLGYNNKRYFFGFTGFSDLYAQAAENHAFETEITYAEIYFGRRFNLQLSKKYKFL